MNNNINSRIKDYFLYALSTIGVFTLLLSASSQSNPAQNMQTSVVPESHVWEGYNVEGRFYSLNKKTGEIRLTVRSSNGNNKTLGLRVYTGKYVDYGETKPMLGR